MKIYIAGPMTGLPEHNYPAFHAAAAAWREAGWEVVNPAENFDGERGLPYRDYVEVDVESIKGCDAMAMLPGWDAGHSGAIWERAIARQILKIPVYDATAPCCPLGFDRIVLRKWQQDLMPAGVGAVYFVDRCDVSEEKTRTVSPGSLWLGR